jgi:hypothetical protein
LQAGTPVPTQINLLTQPPLNYLLDELNALRSLAHPNIVQIHGFCINSFSTFDIYL